jgi:hypothetical protein
VMKLQAVVMAQPGTSLFSRAGVTLLVVSLIKCVTSMKTGWTAETPYWGHTVNAAVSRVVRMGITRWVTSRTVFPLNAVLNHLFRILSINPSVAYHLLISFPTFCFCNYHPSQRLSSIRSARRLGGPCSGQRRRVKR